MTRRTTPDDPHCAITQALDVVGDWWTLLIVRDTARGLVRFDDLQRELGVSRKVLTERLKMLVDADVLARVPYQDRPARYEYRLTARGHALLPTLIALQDWGDLWIMGDGQTTATAAEDAPEARRVHELTGTLIPELTLPGPAGPADPLAPDGAWTVLYCFPGAFAQPSAYPPEWSRIPGARGCTLESCTFRDHLGEFTTAGAHVRGVSTQRVDEQQAFAEKEGLGFPLFSDSSLTLTAALRLPAFRVAGTVRLKRLTLVVDPGRTIRHVLYPVTDIVGSVTAALAAVTSARAG